jgi:hypothetical protein
VHHNCASGEFWDADRLLVELMQLLTHMKDSIYSCNSCNSSAAIWQIYSLTDSVEEQTWVIDEPEKSLQMVVSPLLSPCDDYGDMWMWYVVEILEYNMTGLYIKYSSTTYIV